MTRRLFRLVMAAALIATLDLMATPALAFTCTLDGSTHTLTIDASGSSVFLRVSSGHLQVNNTDCGAVSDIDTVVIDAVGVDLSPTHPFGPGHTDEGDGSSELEFELHSVESIEINGTTGPNTVSVGYDTSTAINLNVAADGASPDTDMVLDTTPRIILRAGPGNDVLRGDGVGSGVSGAYPFPITFGNGDGADTIVGGSGDDLIRFWDAFGDGAADTYSGGPGRDEAEARGGGSLSEASITLDDRPNDGPDCPGTACDHDNFSSDIEHLTGSGADEYLAGGSGRQVIEGGRGNDVLHGGGGNDLLLAGGDDDRVSGGAGDDRLEGGAGSDTVSGGLGKDTLTWGARTGPIRVDLDGQANDGHPGERDNIEPDVEVLFGTPLGDSLTGDDARNVLWGLAGDDVLSGRGKDDKLFGGSGDDKLDGGPGTDLCLQGRGTGATVACER